MKTPNFINRISENVAVLPEHALAAAMRAVIAITVVGGASAATISALPTDAYAGESDPDCIKARAAVKKNRMKQSDADAICNPRVPTPPVVRQPAGPSAPKSPGVTKEEFEALKAKVELHHPEDPQFITGEELVKYLLGLLGALGIMGGAGLWFYRSYIRPNAIRRELEEEIQDTEATITALVQVLRENDALTPDQIARIDAIRERLRRSPDNTSA